MLYSSAKSFTGLLWPPIAIPADRSRSSWSPFVRGIKEFRPRRLPFICQQICISKYGILTLVPATPSINGRPFTLSPLLRSSSPSDHMLSHHNVAHGVLCRSLQSTTHIVNTDCGSIVLSVVHQQCVYMKSSRHELWNSLLFRNRRQP